MEEIKVYVVTAYYGNNPSYYRGNVIGVYNSIELANIKVKSYKKEVEIILKRGTPSISFADRYFNINDDEKILIHNAESEYRDAKDFEDVEVDEFILNSNE